MFSLQDTLTETGKTNQSEPGLFLKTKLSPDFSETCDLDFWRLRSGLQGLIMCFVLLVDISKQQKLKRQFKLFFSPGWFSKALTRCVSHWNSVLFEISQFMLYWCFYLLWRKRTSVNCTHSNIDFYRVHYKFLIMALFKQIAQLVTIKAPFHCGN